MVQQAWHMAVRKRSSPAERESPYPQASSKGLGKGKGCEQGKGQADGDDLLAEVAAMREEEAERAAAAGVNVYPSIFKTGRESCSALAFHEYRARTC